MNAVEQAQPGFFVSAGCHINDVMNLTIGILASLKVSAGCHINDVMNVWPTLWTGGTVSAGCHINDVMNPSNVALPSCQSFSWMSYQ